MELQIKSLSATASVTEKQAYYQSTAAVLHSAFEEDPVWNWLLQDVSPEVLKRGGRLWSWEAAVATTTRITHPSLGKLLAVKGSTYEPVGAQIWWPPGEEMSLLDLLRSGFLTVSFRFGCKTFFRFVRTIGAIQEIHHRVMGDQPHCYLGFLGAHQSFQGTGVGSKMLSYALGPIDAANLPCYLENSNPKNLRFYERFGFKMVEEYRPDGNGPVIYIMVRPPKDETASRASLVPLEPFAGDVDLIPHQRELAAELIHASVEYQHRPKSRIFNMLNLWILLFLLALIGFYSSIRSEFQA